MGDKIVNTLDAQFKSVRYYTDSREVLGYLHNKTKRFYNYVNNTVHRILCLKADVQWNYVDSKSNPADIGSHGCSTLTQSKEWIEGPTQFRPAKESQFPLMLADTEVREEVTVCKTSLFKDINTKVTKISS